jgi:4-hydroxy-tetrahydrodipicolinate synthase
VIEVTIKSARGRIPVIAGTGSNNTEEALRLTRFAREAGADAVLMITPYYNKPTQKGLYLHFKKVAEEVDVPIILYNIASRTGVNLEPETLARLAEIKNIVGIKEASGSLDQVSRMLSLCGDKITLLAGDDSLALPILAVGGKGVISVLANILPAEMSTLVKEYLRGNVNKAREIHYRLYPLMKVLFIETNPIPIKTSMAMMGMIEEELRLPMAPMEEGNRNRLEKVMQEYGLIK